MRVVFLALRKGMTPLLAGLLVGCQSGEDHLAGQGIKVRQLYRAMDLCGLLRLVFAYVRSAKTPDTRCYCVVRWFL